MTFDLCQQIKARWKIKDIDIVGHSDIAPDRKEDPGELFDWQLLAKNGIGLWPEQISNIKYQASNLTELGYKAHNPASITAFQRHWCQNNINGQWDEECGVMLRSLLRFGK
jgi:N-acetylmuramoyl-L-alanine amidase